MVNLLCKKKLHFPKLKIKTKNRTYVLQAQPVAHFKQDHTTCTRLKVYKLKL
jgi:hypothetical protein